METIIVEVLITLGVTLLITLIARISHDLMEKGVKRLPDILLSNVLAVFTTLLSSIKNLLKAFLIVPLELTTRVVAGLLDIPIILVWKVFKLDVLFRRPSLIKLLN